MQYQYERTGKWWEKSRAALADVGRAKVKLSPCSLIVLLQADGPRWWFVWPVVGRIELFNSNFNVYEHDFHKIRRMCILLVEHIDCLHLSITVAQSIIRCYQNVIRSIQQEKKMLGAILESCEHQCHNCYALVACVPLPQCPQHTTYFKSYYL